MASRCKDGTVTGNFHVSSDELSNFHIDTFSERDDHSGRFAEVSKIKKVVFHVGISSVSFKINRTLHGRLGIRILSSNAESIYRE